MARILDVDLKAMADEEEKMSDELDTARAEAERLRETRG